jgi:hypothetical protein
MSDGTHRGELVLDWDPALALANVARAATGHAAVAPSSVINSRRLMPNMGFLPLGSVPPVVATIAQGGRPAALRDFDPAYVRSGSKPEVTALQHARLLLLEQRTCFSKAQPLPYSNNLC